MSVASKLKAGTHVLMPTKCDGEMAQAIENYFSNTQRHKKNPNSDAMKADCWCALMAYHAMVDVVKARTTEDTAKAYAGKAGGTARAAKLSPERRTEIATQAAKKRWAK